ncbi:hypothetical protein PAMA_017971 [Pampus argenteus]
MMDNPTANESHVPCQSWADQTGWSTASTQGTLLNPLPSSQHLSLGSSSDQRPPCDHLQASNQSDCLSDVSTLSSRSNTHHTSLYKASHISSNLSSTRRFANATIPSLESLPPDDRSDGQSRHVAGQRDYNLQEGISLHHGIRVSCLVPAVHKQIFIMKDLE